MLRCAHSRRCAWESRKKHCVNGVARTPDMSWLVDAVYYLAPGAGSALSLSRQTTMSPGYAAHARGHHESSLPCARCTCRPTQCWMHHKCTSALISYCPWPPSVYIRQAGPVAVAVAPIVAWAENKARWLHIKIRWSMDEGGHCLLYTSPSPRD